ncbi:PREDICTED: uncharacterized protein LOC105153145 [Acromyrmex echinatior]|uniref:uncharacterized protein LOC105153145 n=1 Tax=Acromyrmex echinatior TaxID=103372 RepID=UPI000580B51D|nr:PREDICTED: uncharacterized protein LOC105153145 [Acromyrmex echinatior]
METNRNAAFDFAAMFAPVLLMFAMFLTMFYKLRARWPVKVNCWFCNENTKVWRQHLNWWLCPWCEQYNGFSKNGDYAYDIPEQYVTSKRHTRYCRLSEDSDSRHVPKDSLCTCCNKREGLKLSELANFEPKSEKLFNTELKIFKEYLEARYPLCNSCKLTVRDVLRRQAVWLIRYKMLFFRRKPFETLVSNAKKSETVFRVISTILVSMAMYNHDFIWLPISGLFFHLCACWSSSMRKKNSDVLLIFLWSCVITLVSIKDLTTLQNAWLTTEHIVQYRMVAVCAFITALVSLRFSLYKSTSTGSVVLKKIKLRSRDIISPQLEYNNQNRNNTVPSEMNGCIKPSVYAASELSSTEIKFSKSHSAILRQKLSTITNDGANGYPNSISQNDSPPDTCLNDSLSSLFLNEDPPKYDRITKTAPAIFERRVYSATSSENLFRKSGSKHKCILSPPKLRSVTQTSWVAGGYWQEGMMTATLPTLSRSSSQSSGFGSVGSSNLAPSREPSVHELDRCSSAASEIWRWSCQTARPGLHVARHDSPVPRPQSRYSDVTGSHSQVVPSPTVRTMFNTDDHSQESCVHGSDIGDVQNGSVPAYTGHHTTIVTSPGWLSALLCGSLILNMIVLCTTLLR